MGFYYTPYWMALLGMRDLVHGPRPEQNYPTKLGRSTAKGRTQVRALLSAKALVLGSRSTSQGKTIQEPWAKFHVPEWRAFCHTASI